MTKQTKDKGMRIDHQQGLADYLAMGPERSLRKLRRRYCKTMARPPALVTIEKWSSRYEWVRKAQEHDARVGSRLVEKAEEVAVKDGWDRIQALSDVARAALEKATVALERDDLNASTPAEVRALCEAAVSALRQAELLQGGATARIAMVDTPVDMAPDWIRERLGVARGDEGTGTAGSNSDDEGAVH